MKRLFFGFASAILVLLCLAFVAAHIWDERHPPKYRSISLRNSRSLPSGLDGQRVLLWGETFGFAFGERDGLITTEDYGDHPKKDANSIVLHVPAGVALPKDREWESFAGTLHRRKDGAHPAYQLEVEAIGLSDRTTATIHVLGYTLWVMVLLIAGLLGRLLYQAERHKWRRKVPLANVCLRCGYDIRATPDRCPECGTPTS